MTDLVDYSKVQFLSESGIALSDVNHDYWKLVSISFSTRFWNTSYYTKSVEYRLHIRRGTHARGTHAKL